MKGEVAARAVAFAELARSGVTPPGDVVLVAESDEEKNTADVGLSWLVRERPDVRCDLAINESGGELLELADGRRVVTISVGEKKVASLRLRFFGRAGSRVGAGRRRQPASPSRPRDRAPRRLRARAAALGELAARARGARRRRRRCGGDRASRRAAPDPRRGAPGVGADDGHPDGRAELRARERDPTVCRRDLRLPRAARPGRGRTSAPTSTRRLATASTTSSSSSSRSPAARSRRSTRRCTGFARTT